jgi:moderate conductance mechanosensitive channel
MTLRITVLRDTNGTEHFIPNSTITIVANRTPDWVRVMLDVAFSAQVPEEGVRTALAAAATRASDTPEHKASLLEPVKVEGPIDLAAGAVTYRLVAKVHAEHAADLRRGMISALQAELAGRGLRYDGAMIVQREKAGEVGR